jgi:hypothetical protein
VARLAASRSRTSVSPAMRRSRVARRSRVLVSATSQGPPGSAAKRSGRSRSRKGPNVTMSSMVNPRSSRARIARRRARHLYQTSLFIPAERPGRSPHGMGGVSDVHRSSPPQPCRCGDRPAGRSTRAQPSRGRIAVDGGERGFPPKARWRTVPASQRRDLSGQPR